MGKLIFIVHVKIRVFELSLMDFSFADKVAQDFRHLCCLKNPNFERNYNHIEGSLDRLPDLKGHWGLST